jgi:hypothetical protein
MRSARTAGSAVRPDVRIGDAGMNRVGADVVGADWDPVDAVVLHAISME